MSDWDTSSDEDAGAPGRPPSSAAAAGRLWQPPPSPSQSRASVEGGGRRRSADWRWEAAAGFGGEEWEPRGAAGSRGPGEAAWQLPPPHAAGQAWDAAAPLCFRLDSALVGALIGNNGRPPTPRGAWPAEVRGWGRRRGPARGEVCSCGSLSVPLCPEEVHRCLLFPWPWKGPGPLRSPFHS